MQRRAAQLVPRVDFRAEIKQDADSRGRAGRGGEMERGVAEAVVGQLRDRAAAVGQFVADICGGRAGPEIRITEVAANLPGVESGKFVRINRRTAASCERRSKQRDRCRSYQNRGVTPPPPARVRTSVLTASTTRAATVLPLFR